MALALLSAAAIPALAQTRVRTETVRRQTLPPPPAQKPEATGTVPVVRPRDQAALPPGTSLPEIRRDLALLPAPVARMREKILAAARSGDLAQMRAVMGETMPIFSLDGDKSPVASWRATFPDTGGIEILSIVTEILEAPFLHVDEGTPQEMYLWPYFARYPLKSLTPAQRVELFRIVTGPEYKEMRDTGTYTFYRLGIGADGTWRFLVAGE